MPLVSIIIPTFNRAPFLTKTLEAIQAQTHQEWECIIVDDGSTDNSHEIITAFAKAEPRIRYVKRPSDRIKGANSCRNYGFELATGDFVNWFDSDDVMLPGFLEKRLAKFEVETQFVYCSGYYVNNNLEVQRPMQVIDTDHVFRDFILWNLHIITDSVLFRKRFLDGKELFNPKIKRGQETDLFSRLFFKVESHQHAAVHEALFLYRQHDESKSGQHQEYNPDIQESVAYLYAENLKRGLEINDKVIVQDFYRRNITLWFRAFSFKNKENMNYIESNLKEALLPTNKLVYGAVKRTFGVCKLLGIPSYKMATYLRSKTLKLNK